MVLLPLLRHPAAAVAPVENVQLLSVAVALTHDGQLMMLTANVCGSARL